MSNYNYKNLRIMVNVDDPENEQMMAALSGYGTRARNQLVINAIKQYLANYGQITERPANNINTGNDAIMVLVNDISERLSKLERISGNNTQTKQSEISHNAKGNVIVKGAEEAIKEDKEAASAEAPREAAAEYRNKQREEMNESREEVQNGFYDEVPDFALDFIESLQ